MLQRSTWSSMVLSAAVFSAAWLTSSPRLFAQDAGAPSSPAAADNSAMNPGDQPPAPNASLSQLADDFMHYSLVNNDELAKANAQAILNANPAPADLVKAFEDSANGRNPRDIMTRDQQRSDLKQVATQLLDRLDAGYRAVARDPQRIRADIDRLANGPRAYENARNNLVAAGQFAAPLFIEYLQNDDKKNLQPYIVRVMGEIGRPLVLPLVEALNTNDPALKITLINTLGEIAYPQALPQLREIQASPNLQPDLKQAVDRAIASIDRSGTAANAAPANLYLQAAQDYYDRKPSYQPLLRNEKTNPVWVWDKGLNNVAPLAVPTPIWGDVMTLRNTEATLRLNQDNSGAISLWLAADLHREINLPQGAKDPTLPANAPDANFYARAFGPIYVNPVLARALDSHDAPLALRAIDALEATGGISGLVSSSAGAPLVRALNYPDHAVRFRAAFALARANPAQQFPSYFRVVPILAEALGGAEKPVALVVSPDDDLRNKVADELRNGNPAYTVFSDVTVAKALSDASNAGSINAVVISAGSQVNAIAAEAQNDHRLDHPAVVVLASGQSVPEESSQYAVVDPQNPDAIRNAIANFPGNATAGEDQSQYTATSLDILGMLAMDHKSIYNVADAVPALGNALRDKNHATATAAARVLGELNNPDAQKALANAALAQDVDPALRAPFLTALAESAKHTGNTLDGSQVNSLIKLVQSESNKDVRTAAATALGALNVASSQASQLILQQSTK